MHPLKGHCCKAVLPFQSIHLLVKHFRGILPMVLICCSRRWSFLFYSKNCVWVCCISQLKSAAYFPDFMHVTSVSACIFFQNSFLFTAFSYTQQVTWLHIVTVTYSYIVHSVLKTERGVMSEMSPSVPPLGFTLHFSSQSSLYVGWEAKITLFAAAML